MQIVGLLNLSHRCRLKPVFVGNSHHFISKDRCVVLASIGQEQPVFNRR